MSWGWSKMRHGVMHTSRGETTWKRIPGRDSVKCQSPEAEACLENSKDRGKRRKLHGLPSCFSHVWLFATLWITTHQASLTMRFSRQKYWVGLSWPPPVDLHDPGIEPESHASPLLAGRLFTTSTTWEAGWSSVYWGEQ